MSDHNERACTNCGSLLHHEDNCLTETKKANWPDDVRLIMIEKSDFYENPKVYQYGYYDGYQKCFESRSASNEAKDGRIRELEEALNLAQAEIRAMYRRVGINGSNVLDLVDSLIK